MLIIVSGEQEPYPRSFDLENDTPEFHLAPTDVGLCQVYNGNTMMSTFAETDRIEGLSSALDQRDAYVPKFINGSGKIYQKIFWLDIGDRYKHNHYVCYTVLTKCKIYVSLSSFLLLCVTYVNLLFNQ